MQSISMARSAAGLSSVTLLILAIGQAFVPAHANTEDLMRLLQTRSCRDCRLQDADLVHADLRDADLRGAALQRANLGQARLDGARLEGADLSFTSLQGASLRGADLRGARLEGTDLRQSDLSGVLLDPGALARTHWQQARGLDPALLSYPDLHNAGVEAAIAGRHPEAETLFGDAIRQQPQAAISWVARGIARGQQGKTEDAIRDFNYAATLYEQGGDLQQAKQLKQAAFAMGAPSKKRNGGNGVGGQLLTGALGIIQALAPLAAKAFIPVGF
jgi:tetratricopeptide (TPR) repeat protein